LNWGDSTVLVTGGTGSFGRKFTEIMLREYAPKKLIIFSRDELKQHEMRQTWDDRPADSRIRYFVGDIRDRNRLYRAMRGVDVVVHAAAMKQVPACEYHPAEAARINVGGAENVVRAIRELHCPVEAVVTVSTDKACKPVNVMGMTKAIQERVFTEANLSCRDTRFMVARYGNVIASRGSVIPLFAEQIRHGGPLTITSPQMTRFLMSLDRAVDTVAAALEHGRPGETFVPQIPAARIAELAEVMAAGHAVEIETIGERPGEKSDEVLISAEEAPRTSRRGDYFVIGPILPELRGEISGDEPFEAGEYSSADAVIGREALADLLRDHGVIPHDPSAVPAADA